MEAIEVEKTVDGSIERAESRDFSLTLQILPQQYMSK